MIAVIQRVKKAKVIVRKKTLSDIGFGYLILLGICSNDNDKDVIKIAKKISSIRIMPDNEGKMNTSIHDVKGEVLLVSQFTLCADLTYGRRPSFLSAMKPEKAEKIYSDLVKRLKEKGISVKTGKFGEYMSVALVNDGPVTIIIDSKKL